jgi:hypothetical protein
MKRLSFGKQKTKFKFKLLHGLSDRDELEELSLEGVGVGQEHGDGLVAASAAPGVELVPARLVGAGGDDHLLSAARLGAGVVDAHAVDAEAAEVEVLLGGDTRLAHVAARGRKRGHVDVHLGDEVPDAEEGAEGVVLLDGGLGDPQVGPLLERRAARVAEDGEVAAAGAVSPVLDADDVRVGVEGVDCLSPFLLSGHI